jgi:hypothetical protein
LVGVCNGFVSTFSTLRNHFVPPRSQRSALSIHLHRLTAMAEWKSVTAAARKLTAATLLGPAQVSVTSPVEIIFVEHSFDNGIGRCAIFSSVALIKPDGDYCAGPDIRDTSAAGYRDNIPRRSENRRVSCRGFRRRQDQGSPMPPSWHPGQHATSPSICPALDRRRSHPTWPSEVAGELSNPRFLFWRKFSTFHV